MNEFKDLKGLPPEKLPHKPKPIPNELGKVENNYVSEKTKLAISDYWNIIVAILSDYALSKLDVTSQNKVLSVREVLAMIGGLIILFLLIYLFTS